MIKYIEGDLFKFIGDKNKSYLIAHCCNNVRCWGAGFVVPLGNKFPEAKRAYLADAPMILGYCQFVKVTDNIHVANMIGQENVGFSGNKPPIRYDAIKICMQQIANFINTHQNTEIVCPLFGSGLAGGDWSIIEDMIKTIWQNIDVNVYYLPNSLPTGWIPPTK